MNNKSTKNNFPELGTYEYSRSILFNDIKDPKKRACCLLKVYQKKLLGKCFFCKAKMALPKDLDLENRPVICFCCITKIRALYNYQPNKWIFTKYE